MPKCPYCGKEKEYRHIVVKPYFKIIYRVEGDIIYMIDIWIQEGIQKN